MIRGIARLFVAVCYFIAISTMAIAWLSFSLYGFPLWLIAGDPMCSFWFCTGTLLVTFSWYASEERKYYENI